MFALWLTTTYVLTSQEPYAIANPAQRRRKQSPKMGVKSYAWCWASTFFQVFGLFIRKLPNERAFLICLCKSHFGNDTVAPNGGLEPRVVSRTERMNTANRDTLWADSTTAPSLPPRHWTHLSFCGCHVELVCDLAYLTIFTNQS